MKLACRNLPMIRAEMREAFKAGFYPSALLLFRMPSGDAKVFNLEGFMSRYVNEYPDMIAELHDRRKHKDFGPKDMLCVECYSNGKYRIGILERRKRRIHSLPSRAILH